MRGVVEGYTGKGWLGHVVIRCGHVVHQGLLHLVAIKVPCSAVQDGLYMRVAVVEGYTGKGATAVETILNHFYQNTYSYVQFVGLIKIICLVLLAMVYRERNFEIWTETSMSSF